MEAVMDGSLEQAELKPNPDVVQIIMGDGQTAMPEGQIIQLDTTEGQMEFLQVMTESGEQQLLQVTPDGQAHLVQLLKSDVEESLVVPTDEDMAMETNLDDLPVQVTTAADILETAHLIDQNASLSVIANNTPEGLDAETGDVQTHYIQIVQEENTEGEEQQLLSLPANTQVLQDPSSLEDTHYIQLQTAEGTNEILPIQDASVLTKNEKIEDETVKNEAVAPSLDTGRPIELNSDTIVTVDGKKCVLRVDPKTNHLVAFPFRPGAVPGRRPRGRPRKVRIEEPEGEAEAEESINGDQNAENTEDGNHNIPSVAPSEQENSAAEGLLGLSDLDGRRRSMRKKKKSRTLADYETGQIEGVDSDHEPDNEDNKDNRDPEIRFSISGAPGLLSSTSILDSTGARGRPAKITATVPGISTSNQLKNYLANLGLPVKRGRGRPRRNPLPGFTTSMPTIFIPAGSKQGVVMSSGQGMASQVHKLPNLLPKPPVSVASVTAEPTTSIVVVQNNEVNRPTVLELPDSPIAVSTDIDNQDEPEQTLEEHVAVNGETLPEETDMMEEDAPQEDNQALSEDTDVIKLIKSEPVDPSITDEEESLSEEELMELVDMDSESSETHEDASSPTEVDSKDPIPVVLLNHGLSSEANNVLEQGEITENGECDSPEKETKPDLRSLGSEIQPAAIIHLPPHLLPLLMQKKDPVKLGLKATEDDLEKLKCPKCDYQAYYQQQYQEHISSHGEDLEKCKCCGYLTFEKKDLFQHFKDSHPKCICSVCDFTAEHGYIIKRHMQRHDAKGCVCRVCGKRYKDQYIMKMHVKMVHMPADVFFECSICSKKFTRKAHLKRHLRIHKSEKPFKCPHCDYRGCERSDISKHLLIHEDPKHSCEICGKAFRHIKNKELHLKRHKGQRDYKCGVCDFYGYTFTDIRKHIERRHTDLHSILCDKCGHPCKTEELLLEHKKECEVIMIEQALAAPGSHVDEEGTIHLPVGTQLGPDGQIMVDGNPVNIVEQVIMSDDQVVGNLPEADMVEGQLDSSQLDHTQPDTEHQIVTTQNQIVDVSDVDLTQICVEQVDASEVELSGVQYVETQETDLNQTEDMIVTASSP